MKLRTLRRHAATANRKAVSRVMGAFGVYDKRYMREAAILEYQRITSINIDAPFERNSKDDSADPRRLVVADPFNPS